MNTVHEIHYEALEVKNALEIEFVAVLLIQGLL